MKRDPRLRPLSSDHHRALVMARKISKASRKDKIEPAVLNEIETFWQNELKPHFILEEEKLLPALEKHGEIRLVKQTIHEHAQMEKLVTQLQKKSALQEFSQLLKQHIRFEEQILFEVSQKKLNDAELEAVGRNSDDKAS